ncbi:hypothetical protein H8S90_00790 [Olivibacter sp. SDN3]|uniref:multiheme c-type cytochrome n=1 Tax=Olivibacter sp. SDN3 TaxID=2764720 RepID=UPI00165157B0|nr:multiheme c-type cytochrome [Olivibacter sp. SDN3]QNL50203.1 hypothetical protein H8S90_00790 [Olivibacter sp. SDN3]
MKRRNFILLFFLLSCVLIIISQCKEEEERVDVRGETYIGMHSCRSCHQGIVDDYLQNAHFNTSKTLTTGEDIDSLGVEDGDFIFNEHTKVGIEKTPGGLYQTAYIRGENVKSEKADIVFGSGKTAYTLAYWYGNKLMQMPLNFLVKEHLWVNSPGFPSDQIYFGRAIVSRCLECHGSYVKTNLIPQSNMTVEEEFVKNSLMAGVDCERCHGPAAEHVSFHQQNPELKEGKKLVGYRQLSKEQRMDMCGICHSGASLQVTNSTFFVKPGDTVKTLPEFADYVGGNIDVHGKQKQLIEASKCYQMSKMDCNTCHSVHQKESPSLVAHAKQCISCHQEVKHSSLNNMQASTVNTNCVDCHMPIQTSDDIGFQKSNSKEKIPYQVRTHKIAVY